ncbi:MAG: hypothetical protein PHW18_03010 [Sulfuricurvum sp.]|uniref:hypothetical protein n=1 Tax=Sulfuricurvum sp. TaxID=2025608 RepID=UPI002630A816|nr:hypothetical protein [Sulfuricurvum sp.]MDD2828528.1 hypothetical protein [Sulfuricurvum sp.]MDD4948941.1 hypothetical protein [Sulfuricurvum sp.]
MLLIKLLLGLFIFVSSVFSCDGERSFESCKLLPYYEETTYGNIKQGHVIYKKECRKCHGSSLEGAKMHTSHEWWLLFQDNAQNLVIKHHETSVEEYFKSEKFREHYRDLYEFLHEYCKDSPNLPPTTG